jgi:hypothetical protein
MARYYMNYMILQDFRELELHWLGSKRRIYLLTIDQIESKDLYMSIEKTLDSMMK